MRPLVKAATLLLPFLMSAGAHALEADKVKHVQVSFVLGVAGEQLASAFLPDTNSVLAGAALGLIPGVLKEVADHNRKGQAHPEGFSAEDLAADALGAFAGAAASHFVSSRLGLSYARTPAGGKRLGLTYTVPLP